MLSGAQPFGGETATDSIGAILHREPDWALLPPTTPRRVRELLASCLAKDRRNRLHDIGDARLELERAIAEPRETAHRNGGPVPWWRSPGVLATVSLVALAVLAMTLIRSGFRSTPPSRQLVVRATLAFPKDLTIANDVRAVAVSPNGAQVVLSLGPKDGAKPPSLFLHDISRLEFRPLPGTDGATFPCWSPDGASLAFFADRKLKRLDLAEGIVRVLCDAPAGRGGSWGSRNTIVFAPSAGGGLMIVSDSGGTPTPVTTPASPSESHRLPQMMPDGERFLYYIQNTAADGVYAFDPTTKKSRQVLSGWAEAFFVEPGTLIFARDENLLAQPFNPQTLELSGAPRPIAADAYYSKVRGYINGSVSAFGPMMYQLVRPPARSRLGWMDRKGERTMLAVEAQPLAVDGARVSKDGRRAAVSLIGSREEQSVAVLDLERGIRTAIGDPALTFSFGVLWGPGDQSVITSEQRAEKRNLISLPLSGGPGIAFFESESGGEAAPGSITPDGSTLLFAQQSLRDKRPDILTVRLDKAGAPRPFLQTPEGEWNPRLSPPGDAVAYDVGDEEEPAGLLKVLSFPTPGAPVQVSSARILAGEHWWIAPGELAWVDVSRRMWSAMITTKDGRLDLSTPKPMFEGKPLDTPTRILDYDMPRERFLIGVEDEPREDSRLIIVSDWRSEVAASGPTGK